MHDSRKVFLCLIAGAVLAPGVAAFCHGPAPGGPADSRAVRIGVLAKRGAERSLEQWEPTAEYLTAEIPGYAFAIKPLGYDEVKSAVAREEVEFVLANPLLYAELEWHYGASRIVTLKNLVLGEPCTVYAGVLFCRSDREDIQHLRDLKGKTFMAVARESFGGWEMAWRELKEHRIEPDRDFRDLRFGGTHDAVVYAVRDGRVDAGTVRTDTLERMAAEGRIRLEAFRVLNEYAGDETGLPFVRSTRVYPEWPLAKLRHTPDDLAQEVAIALMRLSPETPAAKAARCAGWVIPQNYQPVHECLKELRVGPYEDYGKVTLHAALHRYWPWLAGAAALLGVAFLASGYVMRLNRALGHALSEREQGLAQCRLAEETLRLSEARLRQIIDLVPHMIFAKDRQGRFLLANRTTAEAYDMTVEELTGKNHADVHPVKSEVRQMLEDDLAVIESGQSKTIREESFVDAQGNLRWLYAIKIPYTASETSERAVLGVAIDITEQKRAEEALKRSEQWRAESEKLAAVGRLAAGVAHEINNPLTGVLTFAYLLKDKENMDEQDKKDLDLIINETRRASRIVRDLLDFARERPAMTEPLDINEVLRRTVRLLGNQKAFRQITVREDLQHDLPLVHGDMNQLEQVFLNLSLNACEAMHDGGTLAISTSDQDGKVLVKVADTGCGINKQILDRIFEPFFTTKPVGKGTGLGLSVSYGIIKEHGGAIEVESEEGKGTTFAVMLPSTRKGAR
jgi:two-component system sensor histidine kinase TtrS